MLEQRFGEAAALMESMSPRQQMLVLDFCRNAPGDVISDVADFRRAHAATPPLLAAVDTGGLLTPSEVADQLAGMTLAVGYWLTEPVSPENWSQMLQRTNHLPKSLADDVAKAQISTPDSDIGAFYYWLADNLKDMPLAGQPVLGAVRLGTAALRAIYGDFMGGNSKGVDTLYEMMRAGAALRNLAKRTALVASQSAMIHSGEAPSKADLDVQVQAQTIAQTIASALALGAGGMGTLAAGLTVGGMLQAAPRALLRSAGDPFAEEVGDLHSISELGQLARSLTPTSYDAYDSEVGGFRGFKRFLKKAARVTAPLAGTLVTMAVPGVPGVGAVASRALSAAGKPSRRRTRGRAPVAASVASPRIEVAEDDAALARLVAARQAGQLAGPDGSISRVRVAQVIQNDPWLSNPTVVDAGPGNAGQDPYATEQSDRMDSETLSEVFEDGPIGDTAFGAGDPLDGQVGDDDHEE